MVLREPCCSISVNLERKVVKSSTRLSLAESAVSSWVGTALHAETAVVLIVLIGHLQLDHC